MCLYTKFVNNPKYRENKKNKGIVPKAIDERVKLVPIKCGNCAECRKAKASEWRTRLILEIEEQEYKAQFVTLTFNEKSLKELELKAKSKEANAVATIAIHDFLNRWKRKYKKSVKHWLITELGHKGTERLHLHGIMFTELSKEEIEERWGYGIVHVGYSMNEKVVGYIVKYITKVDKDHKNYRPKMFPSPGIGAGWLKKDRSYHKYKPGATNDHLRTNNGGKTGMPIYFRRKQYTDEEREKMWIEKMDKDETYINGHKIRKVSSTEGQRKLWAAIRYAREQSIKQGYGDGSKQKKQWMTKNGKIITK